MTTLPMPTDLAEARAELERLRAESARRLVALYDVYHRADPHPAMWDPSRDTPEEYDRLIEEVTSDLTAGARQLADAVGELEELRGCST